MQTSKFSEKNPRVWKRNFNKADIVWYNEFLITDETVHLQRKLPKLKENIVHCIFEVRRVPGTFNETDEKCPCSRRRSSAGRLEALPKQIKAAYSAGTENTKTFLRSIRGWVIQRSENFKVT